MGKNLKLSRRIQDNVHKLIPVTQEEMRVIDHPLFQRLRKIHQNGLLHLVTPSAHHTRFEHSIGVMHMAQRMLDALRDGSHDGEKKLYPLADAGDGQSACFHQLDESTLANLTRFVRLTALVHDLGHGPLSHVFDTFAPKVEEIEPLLDDPRLDPIRPMGVRLTRGKDGHIRHEAVSCILFAAIWHDIQGPPWIPLATAHVLLGTETNALDGVPKDMRPWLPFVRDIVSSAPIDADRMDYLLRDSIALGVVYGLYEPDRILKAILCVRTADGYRLGWRRSSQRAIEHFVTARFHMFAQIYSHKTNRAIELMLKRIEREASQEEKCLARGGQLDDFIEDYIGLTDESFLERLTMMRGSSTIVQIARDLGARKLWKRLYDYEGDERPFAEAHKAKMEELHPDREFILDVLPLRAMKDLDRGALLMEIGDRGKYVRCRDTESWLVASPIMKTLLEQEQARVRLFLVMDDSNRDTNEALREEAIALARSMRKA